MLKFVDRAKKNYGPINPLAKFDPATFDIQLFATTSQNNQYRVGQRLWPLPIDMSTNAGAINAGDLCYWTATPGVASFGSGLTMSAALIALLKNFVGVSKDQNPLTGGISNPLIYAGIQTDGTYALNTTAGDTYNEFSQVTLGTDAQTIQLAQNIAPAAPATTAVNSGTGGTWSAAAHAVQYTWLTSIGETLPSAATNVTTTAGQNIVVTLTSGYLPSYVLGVCIYVDGIFAGFAPSTTAVTLAGPIVGSNASVRAVPLVSALTIGFVDLVTGSTAAAPSVAGGTGATVPVRIKTGYLTGNGLQ